MFRYLMHYLYAVMHSYTVHCNQQVNYLAQFHRNFGEKFKNILLEMVE